MDVRCVGRQKTGDSTYWTGLLHGLVQQESNDLRFLLFSNKPQPAEIPKSERFEWVTLTGASERLWSLVRFPLAARRLGAHALHTQYNLSPLAHRGVTTVHDVSFFVGPDWFQPRDRFLLQRFVPPSVRRARRVITVSETSKADILRFIPCGKKKIAVTPLAAGWGIRRVNQAEATRAVGAELGLSGPFALTVGTRWPRKNMMLAVQAVERLPDSTPCSLAVTGHPGWGEEAPGARTKTTGYVSDGLLSALYSAAALYLAPSRYEGFGIPPLEAFVCGCPVLCSTGGALPETVGDAAAIEPTWDADHWARTVQSLLFDSSKLSEMRERGFERARSYSWKETARLTEAVYREATA